MQIYSLFAYLHCGFRLDWFHGTDAKNHIAITTVHAGAEFFELLAHKAGLKRKDLSAYTLRKLRELVPLDFRLYGAVQRDFSLDMWDNLPLNDTDLAVAR